MGVPKRKVSRSRRDSRATRNMAIPKGVVSACQTCQAPIVAHTACTACGYYKGVKILTTKTDRMHKRNQTLQAKQAKVQAKAKNSGSEDK